MFNLIFNNLHYTLVIYINVLFVLALYLDVMVLNDIIEQAAGRHSRASDRGGKFYLLNFIYQRKQN